MLIYFHDVGVDKFLIRGVAPNEYGNESINIKSVISTYHARVGELEYPPDLGSGFCGFESHLGYNCFLSSVGRTFPW